MELDQLEPPTLVLTLAEPIVALIQKEVQGHLKGILDLGTVNNEIRFITNKPHNGRYGIARNRGHGPEIADDIHLMWRDADLFVGFTQGRSPNIFIVLFHAATGKADLSRMVFEMRRALREQY